VAGTELDRNAACFAKEKLGLSRILGLTVSEFAKQQPNEKFDVVTFFEVLEHQAAPQEFLSGVKSCLRPGGYIALSVPNRERWQTGPDVLDYPPNHFLRWSARALSSFLDAQGFETLSIREQQADISHTALMINMSLRTGLSRKLTGEEALSFRDLAQMAPEEVKAAIHPAPNLKLRAIKIIGKMKALTCVPLAIAMYPYVRIRGYKGAYLYVLARRKQ